MNQYSSNHQPSHTLWYTPTPQKPFPFVYHNHLNHINTNYDDVDSDNSTTNGNNNMVERSETASSSTITTLDKEHMFEKALTPSDVGKLNRLVIPKQHAEKYLPLASSANAANTSADGGAGGGGLLLGFEDETGKCWRFRYSYWNSSQSYVLTKGWSRYVKEKKLDAGDVVLFERHRFEPDRFFIGWRRRGSNPPVQQTVGWTSRSPSSSSYNFDINNNPNYNHEGYNSQTYYNNNHQQNGVQSQQCYAPSHQVSAFTNFLPQGKVEARQKSKKPGNSKRVRLFGVNLECEVEEEDENIIEDEPQTSDGSSLSSQGQGQVFSLGSGSRMGPTPYNYIDYVGYPPNNHDHMDMNFSQDFNQHMRNGLG